MRLDKYLKCSRIIKRRTVAHDICDMGRAFINGKPAKSGTKVKIGDEITIVFGQGNTNIRVLNIKEVVKKEESSSLYEII